MKNTGNTHEGSTLALVASSVHLRDWAVGGHRCASKSALSTDRVRLRSTLALSPPKAAVEPAGRQGCWYGPRCPTVHQVRKRLNTLVIMASSKSPILEFPSPGSHDRSPGSGGRSHKLLVPSRESPLKPHQSDGRGHSYANHLESSHLPMFPAKSLT